MRKFVYIVKKRAEKRNGAKVRGRKPSPSKPIEKTVIKSSTDPSAGYMSRSGKPKGFHYLAHASIDTMIGIVQI
ncbi:hypothetical protein ACFO25_12845 [Paenactinomyces guangxiensis]|uniref:Transposase n=1 Tax=Paenactinomyces guangxiensis TaxID=1490290 RepID=A0A7W1WRA0_9BACL|nr:hypothetical protein [Paenactinomyces guangxiensis]MBA4494622.1 hypothetical protein [Paenactinomyces guangxiensis]MBH8591615.1 hypothetical protein [Paenactinomyces guangxiensis]